MSRSAHRRPDCLPELIQPARIDEGRRWVACPSCHGLHEQEHDDSDLLPGAPPIRPPFCAYSTLARRFEARVVVVENCESDVELLTIADALLLAFHGWWLTDDDQSWVHPVFGLHDQPGALAVQRGIDGFTRQQFRRLEARC